MYLQSSKKQLNNQKVCLFKRKTAKSSTTFRRNKPNFKNIKIGVSSFETSKYEISPACRGEKTNPIKPNTKPIQSQFKPNLLQRYNWLKLFYDK